MESTETLGAAQVAFDQMLQEDFSHSLTRALSWYACHQFWKNPPAELEAQAEEGEAEEEEEVCPFSWVWLFKCQ